MRFHGRFGVCPVVFVAAWLGASSAGAVACGGVTVLDTVVPPADGGADGSSPADAGFDSISTCNIVQVIPPILTLLDESSGAPICDAFGSGGASLTPCGPSQGCTGTCQYTVSDLGAPSPFSVTVSAPGYTPAVVSNLQTRYCGCNGAPCQAADQVTGFLLPDGLDGGLPPPPAPDASVSGCPSSPPPSGSACSGAPLDCEYGTDPNPYCNQLFACAPSTGAWQDISTSGICAPPGAACPGFQSTFQATVCPIDGQTCSYPQGTCVCTQDPGGLPTTNGPIWSCVPPTPGCPATRPTLGTVCGDPSLTDCDYGQCSGGVGLGCVNGYWTLANVPCPV
jgi:hypothetical protein